MPSSCCFPWAPKSPACTPSSQAHRLRAQSPAHKHRLMPQMWMTTKCWNICAPLHVCTSAFTCFLMTQHSRWAIHTCANTHTKPCRALSRPGTSKVAGCTRPLESCPGLLVPVLSEELPPGVLVLAGPGKGAVCSWQGHVGVKGTGWES